MTRSQIKYRLNELPEPFRNLQFGLMAEALLSVLNRYRVTSRIMEYVIGRSAKNHLSGCDKENYRVVLHELERMGLVETTPRGVISLTERGKAYMCKSEGKRLQQLISLAARRYGKGTTSS